MFFNTKIGIIGAKQLTLALISGVNRTKLVNPKDLVIWDEDQELVREIVRKTDVAFTRTLAEIVINADTLVVTHVGSDVVDLLASIAELIGERKMLFIFTNPSYSVKQIEKYLGKNCPIIRLTTNIAFEYNEAISFYSATPTVTEQQLTIVGRLLRTVGRQYLVEDEKFNDYSMLSSSVPALFTEILESLSKMIVDRNLLPAHKADEVVAQLIYGLGRYMLETKKSPLTVTNDIIGINMQTEAGLESFGQWNLREAFATSFKEIEKAIIKGENDIVEYEHSKTEYEREQIQKRIQIEERVRSVTNNELRRPKHSEFKEATFDASEFDGQNSKPKK